MHFIVRAMPISDIGIKNHKLISKFVKINLKLVMHLHIDTFFSAFQVFQCITITDSLTHEQAFRFLHQYTSKRIIEVHNKWNTILIYINILS